MLNQELSSTDSHINNGHSAYTRLAPLTTAPLDPVPGHLANGVYEISVDVFFNARHHVTVQGVRGQVHNHSFRLQIRGRGRWLDQDQCVIGFAEIRRIGADAVAPLNNQLLNDLPAFANLQPTSEAIVTVLYYQICNAARHLPIELVSLTLWETPTVSITFTPNSNGEMRR